MDYRANLKQLLMKGQMFKLKGQGIASVGSGISHMQIKDYRGSGTISHRAAVGALEPLMQRLNITGQGARKKDYGMSGQGKPKAKKSKGSGHFKGSNLISKLIL